MGAIGQLPPSFCMFRALCPLPLVLRVQISMPTPTLSPSPLQVKTSMLALGACERIRRTARVYPTLVAASALLPELVHIILDAPESPLAGAAMSALAVVSLYPDGRQAVCMAGAAPPLIRWGRGRGEDKKGKTPTPQIMWGAGLISTTAVMHPSPRQAHLRC